MKKGEGQNCVSIDTLQVEGCELIQREELISYPSPPDGEVNVTLPLSQQMLRLNEGKEEGEGEGEGEEEVEEEEEEEEGKREFPSKVQWEREREEESISLKTP